jgi:hypothetical protein
VIVERYKLKNETGKTMFVFSQGGKIYGHIIKDRTNKEPAKFMFETGKYTTLDDLKSDYPEVEGTDVT